MENTSLYNNNNNNNNSTYGDVFARVHGQVTLLYGIKEIRQYSGNNIFVI
jgi:hypothetical protein